MPHQALHPHHWIAHFQAPGGEGMAQCVEVEGRADGFQQGLDGLAQAVMVKGTLPIRIRTEDISAPLPLSKYDSDRPLDAAVLNHPRLAVLRDPEPTIRQRLPLH